MTSAVPFFCFGVSMAETIFRFCLECMYWRGGEVYMAVVGRYVWLWWGNMYGYGGEVCMAVV